MTRVSDILYEDMVAILYRVDRLLGAGNTTYDELAGLLLDVRTVLQEVNEFNN